MKHMSTLNPVEYCVRTYGCARRAGMVSPCATGGHLVDLLVPSNSTPPPTPPWYDPDEEGLCVWGAWQAAGAADYATSLTDLSGNGNNLAEGNGAVPWDAVNGWQFVAASLQYLIATAITDSYTVLVRFSNYITVGTVIAGTRAAANARMELYPGTVSPGRLYRNAGQALVVPNVAAGNMGVAGPQGYFNGVAEGVGLGGWGAANNNPLYIGANDFGGVPASYCDANIEAVVIYDCVLTAPQVLAVATAMAAL